MKLIRSLAVIQSEVRKQRQDGYRNSIFSGRDLADERNRVYKQLQENGIDFDTISEDDLRIEVGMYYVMPY